MILDDTRVSFGKLWEGDYDGVIASYAALMHQYNKLVRYQRFIGIWKHCGKEVALEIADEEHLLKKRPTVPFFTALLDFLPIRIPLKVLDEGHRLKLWPGKNRRAVQALIAETVDILTGTPCGNIWTDILSMCDLLPYEPIKGRTDMFKVFAPAQIQNRHKPPSKVEFSNLIRYITAFTFGRRIDLLNIPGIVRHEPKEFELSQFKSETTLWLIDRFFRCARMNSELNDLNETESKTAMGFCTRAEQESGFPALATYSKVQKDALEKKPLKFSQVQALFKDAVREEQKMNDEDAPLAAWAQRPVEELSRLDFTHNMMKWLLERGFGEIHASTAADKADKLRKPKAEEIPKITSDPNHHQFRKQHARNAAVKALKAINKKAYDVLIDEAWDEEDEMVGLDDDEAVNAARIDTQEADIEDDTRAEKIRLKIRKIAEHAKGLSDKEIFTPRCNALLELYEHIRSTWPDEKMLIWSRFYRALVLIQEAFQRRYKRQVPIYFGELNRGERSKLLNEWQHPALTTADVPLLLQGKAGGVGLTINAASHCIFYEPWWNMQDEAQAERRCVRLGQDKQVHIWKIIANNSFADAIICAGGLRKLRTIDHIMEIVRPEQGQALDLPALVPQYGRGRLGFVNFSHYKELDERADQEYHQAMAEYKAALRAEAEAEEADAAQASKTVKEDDGMDGDGRPVKKRKLDNEGDETGLGDGA